MWRSSWGSKRALKPFSTSTQPDSRRSRSTPERVKKYLGFRTFEREDRARLRDFVRKQAEHLEQTAGLVAASEEFLRRTRVLLPALSTIRRVVVDERAAMRRSIFQHVDASLSTDFRRALDALLVTTGSRGPDTSPLQALKEPPGPASPRSRLREIDKLETIQATGAVGVDLSWLRSTLKKALARRVRHSSAYRLRDLTPGHRYAAVLCFLQGDPRRHCRPTRGPARKAYDANLPPCTELSR